MAGLTLREWLIVAALGLCGGAIVCAGRYYGLRWLELAVFAVPILIAVCLLYKEAKHDHWDDAD